MCYFILHWIYNPAVYIKFQVVFHGIKVNQEEVILDGSDAPVRIDAETLVVSEELAPVAILNKVIFLKLLFSPFYLCYSVMLLILKPMRFTRSNVILNLQIRVPYRPIDSKIIALSTDRDKLPSGKQILALTLTWVINFIVI